MATRNFMKMLEAKWAKGKFVCVGLDSNVEKLPPVIKKLVGSTGQVHFNQAVVKATKDLVCAYKLNIAFYEWLGVPGLYNLHATIRMIHKEAPDVPVILDAKRADIGNTNVGYLKGAFEYLDADAITVNPYLGAEALEPFLKCKDKGIIVLCRTSNPGAGELQDLHTLTIDPRNKPEEMSAEEWLEILSKDSMQLYERVAENVAEKWNAGGNCLIVVGATYPLEARRIRERVGDIPFLLPGIDEQGADVEATVLASRDKRHQGMIINSSRGIIFASDGEDFAETAREKTLKLHKMITVANNKG